MNYYSIVQQKKTNSIIKDLIKYFGLPTIKSDLSIYLENKLNELEKNRNILHVQFLNNQSSFRFIKRDSNYKINSSDQIYLKNKNIKYFLYFLDNIKFDKGIINEVIRLDFYKNKKLFAQCNMNSIFGDLFVFFSVSEKILNS